MENPRLSFCCCNKPSHYAHECKKKKDDLHKHNANYYNTFQHYEEYLFLICNVAQDISNNIWLIDSGCSNHMIGNRSLIENLDDSVRNAIKLGTNIIVNVMGKVMVNILTKKSQKGTYHMCIIP
jgi:hypothetical protein